MIAPRPEPGRYITPSGQKCLVLIRREATPTQDGSVAAEYNDGSYTCAFFRTFEIWGYRRLPEGEQ